MSEASINRFAIYHPHCKDKLSNLNQSFVFTSYYLHFLCSLSHLSATLAYIIKLDLITKKRELLRILLYLVSCPFKTQSLFLSLTLSKMHPVISERLVMSEWQLRLTLTNFFSLAYYSSIKLNSEKIIKALKIMIKDCKYLIFVQNLPKASFNLSCSAQNVKFIIDIDTVQFVIFMKSLFMAIINLSSQISYIICLANTTSKANIMY